MKITLVIFQAGCTVMCRRTEPVLTYVDVVWADVDLPRVPVGGLVDGHPRLAPLQLVVQPDGQDLRWEYLGGYLA